MWNPSPTTRASHRSIRHLLRLNLMTLEEKHAIDRIVLVERPTRIRQKDLVEMLIRSWVQDAELEYYIAQEEE